MKRNFRAEEFCLISAAGKQHSSKYEIGTFILSEDVHSKLHLLIHLFVLKMFLPALLFISHKSNPLECAVSKCIFSLFLKR